MFETIDVPFRPSNPSQHPSETSAPICNSVLTFSLFNQPVIQLNFLLIRDPIQPWQLTARHHVEKLDHPREREPPCASPSEQKTPSMRITTTSPLMSTV